MLMYLGKVYRRYHSNGFVPDVTEILLIQTILGHGQRRKQDTETCYIVNPLRINKTGGNVAIVLSLSGKIDSDRYKGLVSENFSLYEITIEEPSIYFLKSRKQIEGLQSRSTGNC